MKEIKAWKCCDGECFFNEEEARTHEKQAKCPHENVVQYKHFDSPVCDDCGKVFTGRYCPDSPDHCCHYYTMNGQVELNNGTKIDPPEDWKGDKHNGFCGTYETDDACLFCGQPEERK